jgi:uncharacterized membrane protein YfcA
MFHELTGWEWLILMLAAFCVGVAKSGFSGVSLVHVVVMAHLFGAYSSTGIVLPMLICGDIAAVIVFRRNAVWSHIARMLPPALVGIAVGWTIMRSVPVHGFGFWIGITILCLAALQIARWILGKRLDNVPHSLWFAWPMGFLAGVVTMMANAAGPVMALYFLAVALPKLEFAGTSAWFFLIVNAIKVPFSISLSLIDHNTLLLNAVLIPAIVAGLFAGRWALPKTPQRVFDGIMLGFAILGALKQMALF